MSAIATNLSGPSTATASASSDAAPAGRGRIWAGRILSGLVVAFLLFDAGAKIAMIPQVLEASAKLGFTANMIFGIGLVLLASVITYVIPRTSVLGAVLLTGYSGGAICTNVHHGDGAFPVVFATIFALLVWLGLGLRDDRVRQLFAAKPRA